MKVNKESLVDVIQQISGSNQANLQLFAMLKIGEVKKINISTNVSDSLLKLFVEHLMEEFVATDVDYKVKPIDEIDDELANTYYYFDTGNVYSKLKSFQEFEGVQDVLNFSESSFSDIEAFFISISDGDTKLFLYKIYYPINLLKRGKALYLFNSKDKVDEFDVDVLRIDKSFQFIAYENNVLVANLKALENQLGYSDIIIRNAKEMLQVINSLDFLSDMTKLEEMVLTSRIAKKINKVKDSKVINIIENDINRVKNFIDRIPDLKSSLKFNEDNKLEIATKVAVDKLLKLLDDAYLKSELTDEWYDALSKGSIEQPTSN